MECSQLPMLEEDESSDMFRYDRYIRQICLPWLHFLLQQKSSKNDLYSA